MLMEELSDYLTPIWILTGLDLPIVVFRGIHKPILAGVHICLLEEPLIPGLTEI